MKSCCATILMVVLFLVGLLSQTIIAQEYDLVINHGRVIDPDSNQVYKIKVL